MEFVVLGVRERAPRNARRGVCYLTTDRWDDYHFKTQFYLTYLGADGTEHDIGNVKIGGPGWDEDQLSPDIPDRFEELGDFFSVGQDDDYYTRLRGLPDGIGETVMRALRDVAYNNEIFEQVRDEPVTRVSLLRELSPAAVTGRLHRLAHGLVPLTPYSFSYRWPVSDGDTYDTLDFHVEPHVQPPTNIHVVIGRNGAGKTRLLHGMGSALVGRPDAEHVGRLLVGEDDATANDIANVVSVTFSAFDPFDPLPEAATKGHEIKYSYIGLRHEPVDGQRATTKSADELAEEFVASLRRCTEGARRRRWLRAVETLSGDPNFAEAQLHRLVGRNDVLEGDENARDTRAFGVFRDLSSGHSIVLLTMTKLVEKVDERTLVLLDEPESHLHPPLLSAFVRALSDLLTDRNGIAIVATHSPVVLQEVPATCVRIIERSGSAREVFEPSLETFGENVGTLTREVFGLEVTSTGFHALLAAEARRADSYEEAAAAFDNQLGGEAAAVLRGYLARRERRREQE